MYTKTKEHQFIAFYAAFMLNHEGGRAGKKPVKLNGFLLFSRAEEVEESEMS